MSNYLEDTDLLYEIILSKGKGYLTRRCQNYFIIIGENIIRKKERFYKTEDDKFDCLQQGLLHLFSNWQNFNEKKYSSALPYITEIFKRGIADGINELYNRKSYQKDNIKIISINSCNDGKGLSNF
jgi:hypothetical protein